MTKEIIAGGRSRTGKPRSGRLHEVDLLRIVAAVAVVLFHYTAWAPQLGLSDLRFPTLAQITRYGYLGVDLFFIISGFVVLLTAWNRRPHDFAVSRIVRLYPAYWLAVTATAVILALGGLTSDKFRVSGLQYLVNLTMMQSLPNFSHVDGVYWTLWIELKFYLIIFALICIGITRGRVVGLLYAWLAATTFCELQILPGSLQGAADNIVLTPYSGYFIAGMALCLVYRHGPSWTIAGIVALASGHAVYQGIIASKEHAVILHIGMNSVVVASVIIAELTVVGLVALGATRGLVRPWFAAAGTISYPLYLLHDRIGLVIFHVLGGVVNRFLLVGGTIVAMIAVARLVHRQVEVRFAPRLTRVLASAIRSARPAVPAPLRALVRQRGDL